jgi:hypothetical protein
MKIMVKEEKELNSQNIHQEELMKSEFGFVYDFFLPEKKSGVTIQGLTKEQPKKTRKDKFNYNNQSVAFFLPDFFTDED